MGRNIFLHWSVSTTSLNVPDLPMINGSPCSAGMDYTKTVVNPLREVVPRSRVRGFVENFRFNTEVLLLEGETHLGRKPVSLS